ncbi:MAG TPA: HAD-IA family hydrolase [Gaiellaceae bacterium]|nr:HAD-IA family hydrolase [Gaiellaceae bacterium]
MRFPVVLFDLDGTLIDSGAMIVASMRHAVTTVLGREIAEEELKAHVGGSGLVAQMRALDEERVDELVAAYREHNEPLHEHLQPCAGIDELLERLRAEGRRLGIVTAKRLITVRLAFDVLPWLEPHFEIVVGAEDTDRHKPNPDPLLHALERLGAEPREAAYVGDSPFDVAAAKAAGVFAVAVTWGGIHAHDRLEAQHPDALVHDPEELLGVL